MGEASFWDDQNSSKKVVEKVKELKGWLDPFNEAQAQFESIDDLYQEVLTLNDQDLLEDLFSSIDSLDRQIQDLQVKQMLSGQFDKCSCYFSINAGAGGTESCDWVLMLYRMYTRYFEKKGYQVNVLTLLDGEVVGIKNVTLEVNGTYCYGYLRSEAGVHRLVRISPFDSASRRHTSFASVEVTPQIEEDVEIEVRGEDIRVDTFRASGAGGQHVNRTDSAVRITHLATNFVVSCQKERSQVQNRQMCMKMLKAKLYELEMQKRSQLIDDVQGEKKQIAWGSQIRNYVFQPYTLVKDTRTKHVDGNIQKVMDGDIEPFIEAYLREFR
jgi:peptide chain release factor 2